MQRLEKRRKEAKEVVIQLARMKENILRKRTKKKKNRAVNCRKGTERRSAQQTNTKSGGSGID